MSRAAATALMSPLATVTLAWSGRLITCGTTRAARMPRITTTTMISISVKPFCALFTCLPHQLIERQNRQQDGQNDDQHHHDFDQRKTLLRLVHMLTPPID